LAKLVVGKRAIMMRRLTSFINAFVLGFTLVAVSGCGKRGELRLPDEQSQSALFWEQPYG
jgi:predicted small lipoprotein YifL